MLMLIYHPKLLSVALSHEKAQARLVCMGYPTGNNYMELLRHLQKRFKEADEFPHEVGFFLGYPPEDVIGFMDSRKSCKMCGQWKVYGDEKRAAEVFAEYKRCREVLLAQVKSGGTVFPTALPELVC